MVERGYMEVSIYKESIVILVSCSYTNNLGIIDYLFKYYTIKYPNWLVRWFFEKDVIREVRRISKYINVPLKMVYNFKALEKSSLLSSIAQQEVILDWSKYHV